VSQQQHRLGELGYCLCSFDDPDAEQWKLPDPIIPGVGYDQQPVPKPVTTSVQLPDDLSIPAILDRRPA
jgi:hypothetical protein